ncbi:MULTISPECIES: GGDEF domain-containing protein [unclassified Streptomyces]|uniref:GGDEF domain-containing protein n=1 Tax=unclassified Streptomyces TaxID=2593676 RepID=UPI003D8BDC4E
MTPHTPPELVRENHFKTLNDTHGHAAGDAALIETANRLRGWCGRNGTAGRLGGDEFVAVIQDLAAADLDTLTAALHRPLHYGGRSLPLATSVGACRVAALPVPALTAALAAADAAMYAVKGRGRRGPTPLTDQPPGGAQAAKHAATRGRSFQPQSKGTTIMTHRTPRPPRVCPACDGFASAAVTLGGRDARGHLRTITAHCPACHGTGTCPARLREGARA